MHPHQGGGQNRHHGLDGVPVGVSLVGMGDEVEAGLSVAGALFEDSEFTFLSSDGGIFLVLGSASAGGETCSGGATGVGAARVNGSG